MDEPSDKALGDALVKRAEILIAGANANLTDASRVQYQKAFSRLQKRGLTPEKLANTANGFYFYRAALVFHYSCKIREMLDAASLALQTGDVQTWQESVNGLPKLVEALESYRPDPTGQHLANGLVGIWTIEAEERTKAGLKIESHSKRVRLRGLPTDWRERMFSGLRPGSMYQDIIATLSATGARPSEFVRGIEVVLEAVGTLRFRIFGTKTHCGKYGQEERAFSVSVNRSELEFLRDRVGQNGGQLLVTANAGALSDKVRQLSLKVFPKFKDPVSAYCFRHQIAADLKASGLESEEVSGALGHCVDETRGYYGAAQSAISPGGIKNISASRPVRQLTQEKIRNLESRGVRRESER